MAASGTNRHVASLMTIARDPRILPGIHHYCDEWCEHCSLTERCLAFRCRSAFCSDRGRHAGGVRTCIATDAIEFRRAMASVEPQMPPDRASEVPVATVDELAAAALLGLALEYRERSVRFVESPDAYATATSSSSTPSPCDVILRFHSRIYFKVTRAVVANKLADRLTDARAYAAQALGGAIRSRSALMLLVDSDERRRLLTLIDLIAQRIEQQFPGVAALVPAASTACALRGACTHGNSVAQPADRLA